MSETEKPPFPKWISRLIAGGIIAFAAGFVAFAYWATRPDASEARRPRPDAPRAEGSRQGTTAAPGADAALVALGKSVYDRHCAACHGANLEGQPDWQRRRPDGRMPAPPHDDSGHTWHHPEHVLFSIVKHGLVPPYAPPGYQSDMPAFRDILSDEEIRAVLAFIESRWSPQVLEWRRQALAEQEVK
jgi:mono/diheme cytochrome c family protein